MENILQAKILTLAKKFGILINKIESKSRKGFPDLICIKNGVVIFIEVKRPGGGGRLSAHQKRVHADIRNQGGTVYVVESIDEADAVFQRHYA